MKENHAPDVGKNNYLKEYHMSGKDLLNEELYHKLEKEFVEYRTALLEKEPEDILLNAYPYSVREDILNVLENTQVEEAQAEALLGAEHPLDDIYEHLINSDSCCWNEIKAGIVAVAEEKQIELRDKQTGEEPQSPHKSVKEYAVTITERLCTTVTVEAESQEVAEQLVTDRWYSGEYILDSESFLDVDFKAKVPEKTREECER